MISEQHNYWRVVTIVALAFASKSGLLLAQSVPVIRAGTLGVSGFGEFTIGGAQTITRSIGGSTAFQVIGSGANNGGAGVQADYAISKMISFYAEAAYLTGGRSAFNQDVYAAGPDPQLARTITSASTHASSYESGFQVRIPWQRSLKLVPYLTGGAGVLRRFEELHLESIPSPRSSPPQTSATVIRKLLTAAGVGFRYYFTERGGLRWELKAYHASLPGTYARFSFGVFYQFR